jgi:hypothetical protein
MIIQLAKVRFLIGKSNDIETLIVQFILTVKKNKIFYDQNDNIIIFYYL